MMDSNPIPVLVMDMTYIALIGGSNLRDPGCIVWVKKDGKILNTIVDPRYVLRLDNADRIQDALLRVEYRIKSSTEDVQRAKKRLILLTEGLSFLKASFKGHREIGISEDFVGYTDRIRESGGGYNYYLVRMKAPINRYTIAVGNAVEAARRTIRNDRMEIIKSKTSYSQTVADLKTKIVEEENRLEREGVLQGQWTEMIGKLKTESPAQWVSEELKWRQSF